MDDIPVGQSSNSNAANPFGSEFPDEPIGGASSSGGGPLESRIVSKKWNERAGAYEELSELLK
jgi:hypothetical protein